MDRLVGYLLAAGVITCVVCISAGLGWNWVQTGTLQLDYTISGMNFFEFAFSDIRQLFTAGPSPSRLVNLGIVALMLTPFVRVLASMLYFCLAEHNWKYTVFTAFVLGVLTYSLFLR